MSLHPYFVVSCARSGSTSLCTILDEASNGRCVSEPVPNLNRETRDVMDGRLKDTVAIVDRTVVPRVRAALAQGGVYGEKNVTYAPFVRALYERLGCRFVFLRRDGRDVVRSLINWHDGRFGSVYREAAETGTLTPEANSAAASLLVHRDDSDYSRPRPPQDDPLYARWDELGRAEMCAYYWSVINERYVDELSRLPADAWMELDYSAVTPERIASIAAFCGLTGLDLGRIQALLARRINSLEDRGSAAGRYPAWANWDGGMRRRFDAIASGTMRRFEYYQQAGAEWRPARYGEWWKQHDGGEAWYRWMYDGRQAMHLDLLDWIAARERSGERLDSVLDCGCGLGVGYADALADRRYVGMELSERNVDWCRTHRRNPRHEYVCADFITAPVKEQFDLVFSSGTLDNCYDIDAALASMVRHSRKWIAATFYRGWFPDLAEHRYAWSDQHTCFYNDASPARLRRALEALGCRDITIEPIVAGPGRRDTRFETRLLARVPEHGR